MTLVHKWKMSQKGCIPSALAASEFEVRPMLAVPGLVRGLQADGSRDNVERAVPHNEPLAVSFRQQDEAAALQPLVAIGLAAKAQKRRDVAKLKAASSGEMRRWSSVRLQRSSRSRPR